MLEDALPKYKARDGPMRNRCPKLSLEGIGASRSMGGNRMLRIKGEVNISVCHMGRVMAPLRDQLVLVKIEAAVSFGPKCGVARNPFLRSGK